MNFAIHDKLKRLKDDEKLEGVLRLLVATNLEHKEIFDLASRDFPEYK